MSPSTRYPSGIFCAPCGLKPSALICAISDALTSSALVSLDSFFAGGKSGQQACRRDQGH